MKDKDRRLLRVGSHPYDERFRIRQEASWVSAVKLLAKALAGFSWLSVIEIDAGAF